MTRNFGHTLTYLLNFIGQNYKASGTDYETTGNGSFSISVTPGQVDLPEPAGLAAGFAVLTVLRRRR